MAHRDSLIGTELAGYRIESLIGRGGMGAVYLAEHVRLGRKVALKILPLELAASEDFRLRFARESRLAASLDHPHVIPIYESGEVDGVLFIAMRYVDGTDLATLLATEGPLPLGRAARLVAEVGSALDAAHSKGLVHRDVKPGNVLIARGGPDEEDYAYLSDFGLTRLTTSDTALTRTGQFMGTVAYAAPEQFQGRPADAATDLYSLGCVAYECCTGEHPFPREQEAAVMFAHLQEDPPRVSDRRGDAPPALDHVLAKAMAKGPQERFPSGKALGAAMRAAVAGTAASPGQQPVEGPSEVASPRPTAPSAPGPGPRRASRRAVLAALTVLAVVTAAVVAVTVGSGGSLRKRSDDGTAASPSVAGSASSPAAGPSGAPPGLPIRVDTLLRLDQESGEVLAEYPVGANPQAVAVSGSSVWVENDGDVTISKVDIGSGHVTTRGGVPAPCGLFPARGGGVWVDSCGSGEIEELDPNSVEVVQRLPVPNPGAVITTAGSIWAVSSRNLSEPSLLYRFSPSGRLQARIRLGPASFDATVAEDGAIWGNDFGDGTIWRVDPSTNSVSFVEGWTGPDGVVADGNDIWISDGQQKSVSEYDSAAQQTVEVIRNHSGALAVTPDAVWIQSGFYDTLTKVDAQSGQIVADFQLGYSSDMVLGGGSLWITAGPD